MAKQFVITMTKGDRTYQSDAGTVAELTEYYQYTLETGRSYQHERGNKKINCNPKGISSLIKNLEKAKDNAARNGYSGCSFTAQEV